MFFFKIWISKCALQLLHRLTRQRHAALLIEFQFFCNSVFKTKCYLSSDIVYVLNQIRASLSKLSRINSVLFLFSEFIHKSNDLLKLLNCDRDYWNHLLHELPTSSTTVDLQKLRGVLLSIDPSMRLRPAYDWHIMIVLVIVLVCLSLVRGSNTHLPEWLDNGQNFLSQTMPQTGALPIWAVISLALGSTSLLMGVTFSVGDLLLYRRPISVCIMKESRSGFKKLNCDQAFWMFKICLIGLSKLYPVII